MNIYDFDGTIYNGDSTADFYFYCLKKHPSVLKTVIPMAWAFFLYILGLKTKTQFKEKMYRFLTCVKDIDGAVEDFWNTHEKNIMPYYREKHRDDDVVISASPEFLLENICGRLGIKTLIASKVDRHTGKYDGENCHGEEKVRRLKETAPDAVCCEFYSDSFSDAPLAALADKAFIVRKNALVPWDEYEPTKIEKFKKMFLSAEFLMFLIIGVINTVNGVIFAWIYSLLIPNANIAFIVGYISAMVVSYILNSKLTFKESLSFVKYVKFFISYMPNFIIQNIMVIIFYNILHWQKLIVYALAAIIGVPVTFLFMKVFAFRKKK